MLDVIARTDMVPATGHLHVSESWILVREAQQRGVKRIMITHPEGFIQASMDAVRGFAQIGCHIEHSLCMFVEGSRFQRFTGENLREYIEAAGVDRTVMASDLGQRGEMSPIDGCRRGIEPCMRLGCDDGDIRRMVSLDAAPSWAWSTSFPDAMRRAPRRSDAGRGAWRAVRSPPARPSLLPVPGGPHHPGRARDAAQQARRACPDRPGRVMEASRTAGTSTRAPPGAARSSRA